METEDNLPPHKGLKKGLYLIPTAFTAARRAMQAKYLADIAGRFDVPLVQIPLLPQEIKGLTLLAELGEQIYAADKVSSL